MGKKFWPAVFLILLSGLVWAVWSSPFISSSGPFAQFERERAVAAGIIGISGTVILVVWGWRLLQAEERGKRKEERKSRNSELGTRNH